MSSTPKTYICIDLKSFYASVECVDRKLDPLKTNLVVADISRTEKTVCLAVSPSLKTYGIGGRARLFEVVSKVKEINYQRKKKNNYKNFIGESCDDVILKNNPDIALSYIAATPRMKRYIEVSSKIYSIYLKYIAKEDIHVYSIDEVFMDVTNYLKNYKMTAHELTMTIIRDILKTTGITATGGIGTNMYLAKVAMDIVAKHMKADKDGVRIAQLDEMTYRKTLWIHTPLTDFWRVGKGITKRLNDMDIYTMGDIALCAYKNEDILYNEFGINAELLIDHAFGYEPTKISDIKKYKPKANSLSVGQVIHCPYTFEQTKTLLCEMAEDLSFDLITKNKVTNKIVLNIQYDISNLDEESSNFKYVNELKKDYLGRMLPKPTKGTYTLKNYTSSAKEIKNALLSIHEETTNKNLLIRKINIAAIDIKEDDFTINDDSYQISLFTDYEAKENEIKKQKEEQHKEKEIEKTLLTIKKKYGKNSILKLNDLEEEATTIDRNNQVGGHKA